MLRPWISMLSVVERVKPSILLANSSIFVTRSMSSAMSRSMVATRSLSRE